MATRCPRCRRELARSTAFCAGCGAPLLLGEEAAAPLETPLDLDRRRRGPGEARTAAPALPGMAPLPPDAEATLGGALPLPHDPTPAPAGELAALDRSHWDLGRVPAPEPGPLSSPHLPLDELPDLEIEALEVHLERGDDWRRACAWAVDGLPFAAAGVLLGRTLLREAAAGLPAPPSGVDGLLDLLARERAIALSLLAAVGLALALYTTLAHALAGATLGKRLLGLQVVGPDGAPPTPARSAARAALAVLSAGLLGLGFLLALFTRSGRALHDLIARTWVVKAP
jgi:uncharacterized RDD family membrane protein YckC